MRGLLFILAFLSFSLICFAQEGGKPININPLGDAEKALRTLTHDSIKPGWKKGALLNVGFSQVSLNNWAAGGQNSVSINGLFSGFTNLHKKTFLWDNSLDVGYGVLQQGKGNSFIKTDDKFAFTTKFGKKAYKNWYYSTYIDFRTQLTKGFKYPNDTVKISDWLAPAYVIGAIGLDLKKTDHLSFFISAVTTKITIVNDHALSDAGAFGVDPGKLIRSEMGGYVKFIWAMKLMENVNLTTKLETFSNYVKNPSRIDVSWENLLELKVNKYLSTTITTHLIYDEDIDIQVDKNNDGLIDAIGPRTQFKEVLGIGFSYKL